MQWVLAAVHNRNVGLVLRVVGLNEAALGKVQSGTVIPREALGPDSPTTWLHESNDLRVVGVLDKDTAEFIEFVLAADKFSKTASVLRRLTLFIGAVTDAAERELRRSLEIENDQSAAPYEYVPAEGRDFHLDAPDPDEDD